MTAQINAKTMEKAALLYERYGITLDDLLDDVLKRVKMSPVPESLLPVTGEEELAERLLHIEQTCQCRHDGNECDEQ